MVVAAIAVVVVVVVVAGFDAVVAVPAVEMSGTSFGTSSGVVER